MPQPDRVGGLGSVDNLWVVSEVVNGQQGCNSEGFKRCDVK